MTQDQYGQARGPGYVVRGDVVPDDVVPDDETGEYPDDQERPMTRFHKVASALRGGDPEDEQDRTADQTAADDAAAADTPMSREAHLRSDYWDEPGAPAADRDEAVAVASPDHQATEPDMFGTAAHAGNGATAARYPADAMAEGAPADAMADGAPADAALETAGRHAATAPAAEAGAEMRPGEAAAALGDFSDLTYGNLIPDAAQYTGQWHQIQYRFVDDPHASVAEAADIIAQVTARMEAAIQERQRAIEERQHAIAEQQRSLRGRWGEGTNADTEVLRATLRMYRTFLDQLIGPGPGSAS